MLEEECPLSASVTLRAALERGHSTHENYCSRMFLHKK